MPADLTPAEKAVADVPFSDWGQQRPTVGDVLSTRAIKAIVETIRPVLYREAADELARRDEETR